MNFEKIAAKVEAFTATKYASIIAVLIILGWLASGPFFDWSDKHSLFINSLTTCVTFLMTFIIQASQSKNARALHAKLDEILIKMPQTETEIAGIECRPEEELQRIIEIQKAEARSAATGSERGND